MEEKSEEQEEKYRKNGTTWHSDNENIATTNGNVDNVLYTVHRFAMPCTPSATQATKRATNVYTNMSTSGNEYHNNDDNNNM